jgi:hypothetical protein
LRSYSPFTTGSSHLTTGQTAAASLSHETSRLSRQTLAFSSTSGSASLSSHEPPAKLSRLSHALIAKSLVEVLFVVALAVYFSYTSFNPYFRGSVDEADGRTLAGWVTDEAAPHARVEVHLYIDGHFVSRRPADAPRPDVFAAGRSADAYHGFIFNLPRLPPGRTYEARVYAMHETPDRKRRALQEFGDAKRFSVAADEANASVPERWWESEGRP